MIDNIHNYYGVSIIYFTHPDTFQINVDTTIPLQSAFDAEDVPPPIPPKQFSDNDVLQLGKLPENRELLGSSRNAEDSPLPIPPQQFSVDGTLQSSTLLEINEAQQTDRANQGDTTVLPSPPKTKMNQQTTVSG